MAKSMWGEVIPCARLRKSEVGRGANRGAKVLRPLLDDCQFCGACCFSESSAYVPLSVADRERLGGAAARLIHEEDGAYYMAMQDGHCAALHVGRIAFRCSLYLSRPAICRELERGTPACQEERELKKASAARLL